MASQRWRGILSGQLNQSQAIKHVVDRKSYFCLEANQWFHFGDGRLFTLLFNPATLSSQSWWIEGPTFYKVPFMGPTSCFQNYIESDCGFLVLWYSSHGSRRAFLTGFVRSEWLSSFEFFFNIHEVFSFGLKKAPTGRRPYCDAARKKRLRLQT